MAKYRAQEDEEVPEMDDVIEYSQNDLSGGVFSSWTPQKKAIFLVVGIIALLLVIGLVWVGVTVFTTRDYYASIQESASGDELRRELQTLLRSTGQVLTYASLWDHFVKTDTVWHTEQCKGVHNGVSDIFNYYKCFAEGNPHSCEGSQKGCLTREHTWPKCWWGCGSSCDENPAYTDLHHLYPGEGEANTRRSNYPYGLVSTNTYVSNTTFREWKLGPCLHKEGEICAEPPAMWKGVVARVYFYISTRYMNEFTCPCTSCADCCMTNGAVQGSHIDTWMENELRIWHHNYRPTSQEKERNERVYKIQGNRNPYVDHPEWVDRIFDF